MKSGLKRQAEKLLESAALKKTCSRRAIIAVLLDSSGPMRQDEISARLGGNGPNKVTVYRTLETLVGAGVVHKAFLQDRTWHFELADHCTAKQCHPHFTCTNCEQTHCLPDISIPMARSPYKGFVIEHQRVQLDGLCPDCSSEERAQKKD